MRLLRWIDQDLIGLTQDMDEAQRPPYVILSHTWADDNSDEVTWNEVETSEGQKKPGYEKIRFCAGQARKDGISNFWVDTCCINKTNLVELSEAITSMYRWYQDAVKCYVYLPDVSCQQQDPGGDAYASWWPLFQASKWFTRGWTLQELLAPKIVEFYSREGVCLGDKKTLARQISKITGVPVDALNYSSLSQFSVSERMRWAEARQTKKSEDRAYSLLGIFDVSIPVIYGEGEKKAFRRLQREIQEQAGITTQPIHMHWMVPRTANPLFTGRQGLLQELGDTVRDAVFCPWDRDQCRIVISGMGGQGKSEVCLQLARLLRQVFWAVLWIDVSTKDIAERSLLEAARKLSIPAQSWEDALYAIANLSHPWLLILDNADDPETDYRDYFPDSRLGVVVMTSRNRECEQYATDLSVALPGLDMQDAQDLLLKAARISPNHHNRYDEDARKVATLLQSHPLAVIQAGAYLARGHCSLFDYPRVYELQRRRLLTFRPNQVRSRYGDVYATFEVSAEMLRVIDTPASQDALQLLPLLAVCGPSQFPLYLFEIGWRGGQQVSPNLTDEAEDDEVTLLTPWHLDRLPAICDTSIETWDTYRLIEAVGLLKSFSLISTSMRDDRTIISSHALVHAWARDRQDASQQRMSWLNMGCLVACALGQGDPTREQKRYLRSHIEALVDWSMHSNFFDSILSREPVVLVIRILVSCGWYLLEQRADSKLFTLLQTIFAILGLDKLEVEQRWIGLFCLAGRNLQDSGRIREAVTVLEQVLKVRKRTLPADHPERRASQYLLAQAYKINGQPGGAIVLFEEIVSIEKQILRADDLSLLASQRSLAGAYRANGQVREAVVLLEEVVKVQKRKLPADHPERHAAQSALAMAYKADDKTSKAIELLRETIKVHNQTLAEDHPHRLSSLNNLAVCLWDVGECEEAISMMAHVVDIQKQALDKDHPDRLDCEEWLAIFTQRMADGRCHERLATTTRMRQNS